MVKTYVVNGLGIGCHQEVAHAYGLAGAEIEIVHLRKLLAGGKDFLFESQILNLSGGFLQGDMLGAGMCAANEIEQAEGQRFKDLLLEYVASGGVIYGQCNGFQLLVKTGLLPGIEGDYSQQTLTLTHNDCGQYRVSFVDHQVEQDHFAFLGIDVINLICRHGEGKVQFYSSHGLMGIKEGEENRRRVNANHVLLRYVDKVGETTEEFPANPNGSVDGIAGLVDESGHIFGHMAHPEVGVYTSRNPRFFEFKDQLRRAGVKAAELEGKDFEDESLTIFRNIVDYLR